MRLDRRVRGLPRRALHHARGAALGHEHEPGAHVRLGAARPASGRGSGSTSSGPRAGMLLAVEVYRLLRRTPEVICAKLNHHTQRRCIFRCGYAARGRRSAADAGDHPMSSERYDVIIVGSGAGGAAAGLQAGARRQERADAREGPASAAGRQHARHQAGVQGGQVQEQASPGATARAAICARRALQRRRQDQVVRRRAAALLGARVRGRPGPPVPRLAVRPRGDRALLRRGRAPAARQPLRQRARAPGADRQDRPQRLGLARRGAAARPQARDPRRTSRRPSTSTATPRSPATRRTPSAT